MFWIWKVDRDGDGFLGRLPSRSRPVRAWPLQSSVTAAGPLQLATRTRTGIYLLA